MASAGTDVVLTTQYLDEADQLAACIVIIDGGRVIAQGTPGSSRPGSGPTWSSSIRSTSRPWSGRPRSWARSGSPTRSRDPSTRRCSIAAPGGSRLLPVVVRALDDAHVEVEDITLRRPTLDEVFLALTGRTTAPTPTKPPSARTEDAA